MADRLHDAPPLTPEELAVLRERHAPIPSGRCTVCRLLRMLDDQRTTAADGALADAKVALAEALGKERG